MMKPLPDLCHSWTKVIQWQHTHVSYARFSMLIFILLLMAGTASAQTVTWSDSFQKGQAPTQGQCQNWTSFLDQLAGKSFTSVSISGTFDQTGKSINDPAAANALATLLSTRTPGTVESGNHYWSVTICQVGACGGMSIALSVDGSKSSCECTDTYTIRPQSTNEDWGGVNVASSCNAASQSMKLVFNSGVSISASGPTTLCEGSSVVLTANAAVCASPLTYLWNNGATTQSITVSQAGTYSVSVTGANGCAGTESISVMQSDVAVNAGDDTQYCQSTGPVQLGATGSSAGGAGTMVNEVCIYNSPGGVGIEDCNFTTDVCLEGATFIGNSTYNIDVAFSKPVELRYQIYYSAFADISTIRLKLNNQELGSFVENNPTGVCDTKVEQKFPRSFVFTEGQFKQHWIEGGNNKLSIVIETPPNGIYLAGITAQVVTSNETYSWSPIAGLSNPSIRSPLATPLVPTLYTVTYTDANGCTATDQVRVNVACSGAPVAVCKTLTVDLTNTCAAEIAPNAFDGGSTGIAGPLTYSVVPAGPYPVGVTNVVFTVTDQNGATSSCTTSITVKDPVLPTIAAMEDIVVTNEDASCSATVTLVAPEASDNCGIESITHDRAEDVFPVGETIVTWSVKDVNGNVKTAAQKVTVNNLDPEIISVNTSASTIAIGSPVVVTTIFEDNNVSSATIQWGDQSLPSNLTTPVSGFETSHTYNSSGTFEITVTITDECGATDSFIESIVVYDRQTGWVHGGGWYESPRGAYAKDRRETGKVNFSFNAKYPKHGSVPVGTATISFKAAKLKFRSSQLTSLTIDGSTAILKGTGSLNNKHGYHILISMVDDDSKDHGHDGHGKKDKKSSKKKDRIRVKVWDSSGSVIYDTQSGDPDDAIASTKIGGGDIEVNSSRSETKDAVEDLITSYFGEESSSVYPNPFTDWLNIQFNSAPGEDVVIQLMDLTGKVIASGVYPVSEDGYYSLDIPEGSRKGIYILTIKQGKRVEVLRLVGK